MKKFRQFLFESIFQDLLRQGGNAVSNVQKIAKNNVQPTLDKFYNVLKGNYPNLKWDDTIFKLGSTGKKDFSGDLDIGIDFNAVQREKGETILEQLEHLFTYLYNQQISQEIKINNISNDMIHLSFPQYNEDGQQIEKNVQIDIILTLNKQFCLFYMYSPAQNQTAYKGAHRNELFRAILKTNTFKPLKTIKKNGEDVVVQWEQQDLTSKGLYNQTKTLVDQNDNWLKYKDTDQDLIQSYAKVLKEQLVSGDPKEVINMLVGDYQFQQINSFEKLLNVIQNDENFKYSNEKNRILSNTANAIRENTRLAFPDQLKDYLSQ